MRDIFHDELDEIGKGVLEMTKLVAVAMERATSALLLVILVVIFNLIARIVAKMFAPKFR